jgi:hypothetical protein
MGNIRSLPNCGCWQIMPPSVSTLSVLLHVSLRLLRDWLDVELKGSQRDAEDHRET